MPNHLGPPSLVAKGCGSAFGFGPVLVSWRIVRKVAPVFRTNDAHIKNWSIE
jgi:hypothetical protein